MMGMTQTQTTTATATATPFRKNRSRSATRAWVCAMSCGIGALAAGVVHAQSPAAPSDAKAAVTYPAKGQDARQQEKDRHECRDWAKGQTGFDPSQPSWNATTSQPTQSAGPGGMARGGAAGAAVAELTHHDTGRGLAAGALGGAMRERVKERQAAQAKQQQAAQQQATRDQQRATYDRAFGACMEARGYVVK